MEKLRVLIADDHPLFRKGLRALLETMHDIEYVGEATTGEEAIALSASLQPDLIVMDIQMPGRNGIDSTRQIVQMSPHVRVLIVTLFEDNESVFAAMRAGARGYVLKDTDEAEMVQAIRSAGVGQAIFSPAIAARLADFFSSPHSIVPRSAFPALTDREREILGLIARGKVNAEIARQLELTPKTVSNYVSNILTKLQVVDRAEAILRAKEAGLG
jgi:DNA-binding NarL/FixJ family response regulator